jgi:hypothetical protein
MRLPTGSLEAVVKGACAGRRCAVIGSLSFEERCVAGPDYLSREANLVGLPLLLHITDPTDAFPDYSAEALRRTLANQARLKADGVEHSASSCRLLDAEDEMLNLLERWHSSTKAEITYLDISSLPKRFFCFFVKRLISDWRVENLIVTYTGAGQSGYVDAPLSEDPLAVDHLPGFSSPLRPAGERLIVSVGFEALNLSDLIKVYRDSTKEIKFLMASPMSLDPGRRQWATLQEMAVVGLSGVPQAADLEVISFWDAETTYLRLERWADEVMGRLQVRARSREVGFDGRRGLLAMAPFGPKPHSLGMALFGIKHRCGLFYSQPKAYNPLYTRGIGQTWAYVVKWEGVPCFDRPGYESAGNG